MRRCRQWGQQQEDSFSDSAHHPYPGATSLFGFEITRILVETHLHLPIAISAEGSRYRNTQKMFSAIERLKKDLSVLGNAKHEGSSDLHSWTWDFLDHKKRKVVLSIRMLRRSMEEMRDGDSDRSWASYMDIAVNYEAFRKHLDDARDTQEGKPSLVTGTGWFVSSNMVVTCYHVVAGKGKIECLVDGGKGVPAELAYADEENDIAVLRVAGGYMSSVWLPLRIKAAKLADRVCTFGYPMPELMGQELKYTEGSISGLSGIANNPRTYQISVPLQPGNSGGALLDDRGYVIGLTSSVLDAVKTAKLTGTIPQNVNYAIKVRYLIAILDDNGVEYCHEMAKCGLKGEGVSDCARATVMIVARKGESE